MLRALIVVLLAILPLASASAQDGARAATTATVTSTAVRAPATCQNPTGGLGVARIVEIDTAAGPLFGKITKEEKEASFLQPKEVVLTFDDGPMPWITRSILDTLDRFCTKATFFSVGRMALAYPQSLRDVLDRGHTLGGHTWSHPLNLKRLKPERAIDEIERGFAAISIASGGRTSPFFRFPGLSDNAAMLAALQKRGIASFTVDVVSDDSYISDPDRLTRVTLERLEAQRGGIMLFHDIKPATAKALPGILAELQRRGYKVVHMRSKALLAPLPELAAELHPLLAKADPPKGTGAARAAMLPFYGALGPEARAEPVASETVVAAVDETGIAVDQVAPEARVRRITAAPSRADGAAKGRALEQQPGARRAGAVSAQGWNTSVTRTRLSRPVYD